MKFMVGCGSKDDVYILKVFQVVCGETKINYAIIWIKTVPVRSPRCRSGKTV